MTAADSRFRRRKHPRLDVALYADEGLACSVTIATLRRKRVFADPPVALAAVRTIEERAKLTGVPVYGYCVMPDHVHLVLSPSRTCDIITFVGHFKNLAQREAWALGVKGPIWQRGFWDHFLRKEEELAAVVAYVIGNPVRAGLAVTPEEYPYCGSLAFERQG